MSAPTVAKLLYVEEEWEGFLNALEMKLCQGKPLAKRQTIQLPFLTFKEKETAEKFYAGLNRLLRNATKGYAASIVEGPAPTHERIFVSVTICRNQKEADIVHGILVAALPK